MSNLAERLRQLADLHASGVLTDEEFQAAKQAEIIKESEGGSGSGSRPTPPASASTCPVCHKDDQATRTSHIASSGTSSTILSGSLHGAGSARSSTIPSWRPFDLGDWYSSSTAFGFSASIVLSGMTTTTLAAQLAPPPPPPNPIPEGEDSRYALYSQMVKELWERSFYCARDGIVFIADSDYPPIDPPDYQKFLLLEPVGRTYERVGGVQMKGVQRTKKPQYAISLPSAWHYTEELGDGYFAPRLTRGFTPYVIVKRLFILGGGKNLVLWQPLGQLPGHEYFVASKAIAYEDTHADEVRRGLQCPIRVTTPHDTLSGWGIAFSEGNRRWFLTFVTHPSCVALDSILFAKMLASFSPQ